MTGVPIFPNFEYILSNDADKLTEEQRAWFALLRLADALFFQAGKDEKERLQSGYNRIKLSGYLHNLTAVKPCGQANALISDKLMMIAENSDYALSRIVASPRTRLEKVTCKQHISKIREISPQTVEWLAMRPQETLAEKIKPANEILTKKVVFTPDTLENRLLKYYYGNLHKYVYTQLGLSACADCPSYDSCEKIKGVSSFLRIKNRIRQSELQSVPAKMCAVPNNVLLCDKYYKVIWKSLSQVRGFEDSVKELWDKLESYVLRLELLIKVAGYLRDESEIRIVEKIVYFKENVGLIDALNDEPLEEVVLVKNNSQIIRVFIDNGRIKESAV